MGAHSRPATYEMPVEAGKILEFARASHSAHPAYAGEGAVVPATFLTIAGLTWEPAESSVAAALEDGAAWVYDEEEYVFHGPPPRAGATLRVVARLAERTGRGGGAQRATVVRQFRDEQGALVAEQRTTWVEAQPRAGGRST